MDAFSHVTHEYPRHSHRRSAILKSMSRASMLILLPFVLMLPAQPTRPANARYDLGGPCQDVTGPGVFAKIEEARKSGSWDRVIELEKASVREACRNSYRWQQLLSALLKVHRETDALQALQDMDTRGLDLSPAVMDRFPEVREFMESPLFKESPAGTKIQARRRIA